MGKDSRSLLNQRGPNFYNFVYEFANDIDIGSKPMDIKKAQIRIEHLSCARRS